MLFDLLEHDRYDLGPSGLGLAFAAIGEAAQAPAFTWLGLAAVGVVQFARVSPRLLAVLLDARRDRARLAATLAELASLRRERERRAESDAINEMLTGVPASKESPR